MNVYITFSNEPRPAPTGVYTNMNLAHKEKEERRDLDCIDILELKGLKDPYWLNINTECKHYHKHLYTIAELIACLYELEDCLCGGLAHVVVDDDNFDDDSINFVLNLCEQEENKDKEEVGLVKLICEELKKMSIQQRALLFTTYRFDGKMCIGDCEKCRINHGEKY